MKKHAYGFEEYKRNVVAETNCQINKYRLVMFVEDISKPSSIMTKKELKHQNPFWIKEVIEILCNYRKDVWGIIYSYSNEFDRVISGYTLEGSERINTDGIKNLNEVRTFEKEKIIKVPCNEREEIVVKEKCRLY